MARQSYLYTDFSMSALKDKVQEKSGIQVVNMRSCNELAAQLETHDLHISAHTLARFFRVIANSNMPSQYTLDQLASFVGYNSWSNFHKQASNGFNKQSNGSSTIAETELSDSELSLIRFCLQDGAYGPLQNYFNSNRDIFGDPFCPKSQGILKTLTESLNINPKVRLWLFSYMLKDNFIGSTYFGHEINVDAISSYFGDAVDEYFLKLIHPSDNLYSSQTAWAHAIIMMQAFYQGDKKKLLQQGYELFKLSPPEENTLEHHLKNGQTFIWVFARYHFVHILYLYFADKAKAQKIEQKVKDIAQQLSNATQLHKIITYSLLFEALTHIGYSHLIDWFTPDYTTIVNNLNSPLKLKD